MVNYPECPVDLLKADENQARITAFFVVLLTGLFLATGSWWIPGFLSVDFALRAFQYGKASPLAVTARSVVSLFRLTPKPTDRGPKVFAARIGLAFSVVVLVTSVYGLTDVPRFLGAVLLLFAFLESVFGFCAACFLYPYWKSVLRSFK